MSLATSSREVVDDDEAALAGGFIAFVRLPMTYTAREDLLSDETHKAHRLVNPSQELHGFTRSRRPTRKSVEEGTPAQSTKRATIRPLVRPSRARKIVCDEEKNAP